MKSRRAFAKASAAHLLARVASLASGIASIPMVTHALGNDALGLIGLQASLVAMLGLVDFGLPTAAARELATLGGQEAHWEQQARIIRSFEALLWALAAVFMVVGLASATPLAESWLRVETEDRGNIREALAIIIIGVAVRFPIALYANVSFALGHHVLPNVIVSAFAALRILGGAIVLFAFQGSLGNFFLFQLFAGIGEVGMLAAAVWWRRHGWSELPQLAPLRAAAGQSMILTGISLTAVGLSQIDKVVLSKILLLGEFGIYSATYSIAAGLLAFSYPVCNAIFPGLSQSLDQRDFGRLEALVRWGTELTILLAVPLAAAIAVQAQAASDLLFFFRGKPHGFDTILPLMILGGLAQAFVTVPHFFQIAQRRAAVVLWINAAFLPVYALMAFLAASLWGIDGAAIAFLLFNVARLLVHWIVLALEKRTFTVWRKLPQSIAGLTLAALAIAYTLRLGSNMLSVPPLAALATTIVLLVILIVVLLPSLRDHLAAIMEKDA